MLPVAILLSFGWRKKILAHPNPATRKSSKALGDRTSLNVTNWFVRSVSCAVRSAYGHCGWVGILSGDSNIKQATGNCALKKCIYLKIAMEGEKMHYVAKKTLCQQKPGCLKKYSVGNRKDKNMRS